jgi:hypothetical protein
MVGQNQQNSTSPWIGWAFRLTKPNPGYGPRPSGMKCTVVQKRQNITYRDVSYGDETYRDVKYGDVSSLYFGGGCGGYGREVALGVPVLDFLSTSKRRGHQERDCMLASHRRLGSGSCKHFYI